MFGPVDLGQGAFGHLRTAFLGLAARLANRLGRLADPVDRLDRRDRDLHGLGRLLLDLRFRRAILQVQVGGLEPQRHLLVRDRLGAWQAELLRDAHVAHVRPHGRGVDREVGLDHRPRLGVDRFVVGQLLERRIRLDVEHLPRVGNLADRLAEVLREALGGQRIGVDGDFHGPVRAELNLLADHPEAQADQDHRVQQDADDHAPRQRAPASVPPPLEVPDEQRDQEQQPDAQRHQPPLRPLHPPQGLAVDVGRDLAGRLGVQQQGLTVVEDAVR